MTSVTVLPGLCFLVVSLATVVHGECPVTAANECLDTFIGLAEPCTESNILTTTTCLRDALTECAASDSELRTTSQTFRRKRRICMDPCQSSPCRNGGTCANVANTLEFNCACAIGFAGDRCDDALSATKSADCDVDNGGCMNATCLDTRTSVRCVCEQGYQWDSASSSCEDINECESGKITCEYECENTEGNYTCKCAADYTLQRAHTCVKDQNTPDCVTCTGDQVVCEFSDTTETCLCNYGYVLANDNACNAIDECTVDTPCVGDAVCADDTPGFQCSCPHGFSLRADSLDCEDCAIDEYGDNCSGDCGTCDANNTVTCHPVDGCVCRAGWEGTNCDTEIDECEGVDCGQGSDPTQGSCEDGVATYECQCQDGYENEDSVPTNTCIDFDECLQPYDNDCESSLATCVDEDGSYRCDCPEGYELDSDDVTCTDIKECDQSPRVCSDNGDCTERDGGYTCDCHEGFDLNDGSTTCIDIIECDDPGSHNCTGANEDCFNTVGGFQCICKQGFEGDPCGDENECVSNPTVCGSGNCTNAVGGYMCDCHEGYELNSVGSTCEDINECADESTCPTGSTCMNTAGSFTCPCQHGYELLQSTCTDIDECADDNPCASGSCNNTAGSYTCDCDPGYSATQTNSSTCIDIDECALTSDACEHYCKNTKGGFTCSCKGGYNLNNVGGGCTDIDECLQPDACRPTYAFCSNKLGVFLCLCTERSARNEHYLLNVRVTTSGRLLVKEILSRIRLVMQGYAAFWNVTACTAETSQSVVALVLETRIPLSWAELAEMAVFADQELPGTAIDDGTNTGTITSIELLDDVNGTPSEIAGVCSVFDTLTVCQNGGDCMVDDNIPTCICQARTEGDFCERRTGLSTTILIVIGVASGVVGLFIILSAVLIFFYCRLLGERRKRGFKPHHNPQAYNQPRFGDPHAHSVPDKDTYRGSLGHQRDRDNGSWWHHEGHHTQRSRAAAFNPASFRTASQAGWGPTNNNWHDDNDTFGRERYPREGVYDYSDDPGFFNSSPRHFNSSPRRDRRSPPFPSTNA